MPLHVSSTCAHRHEVKIVLYNIWYCHACRWPSGAHVERGVLPQPVHRTAIYTVWWYQRLYSKILASWRWAHVLETCRDM